MELKRCSRVLPYIGKIDDTLSRHISYEISTGPKYCQTTVFVTTLHTERRIQKLV